MQLPALNVTGEFSNSDLPNYSNQIFLIYKEIRRDRLQSHIWLTASSYIWLNICAFPPILESHSSYMTLQPIPSEFPCIWGKFLFLFNQCKVSVKGVDRWAGGGQPQISHSGDEHWVYSLSLKHVQMLNDDINVYAPPRHFPSYWVHIQT